MPPLNSLKKKGQEAVQRKQPEFCASPLSKSVRSGAQVKGVPEYSGGLWAGFEKSRGRVKKRPRTREKIH